MKSSSGYVIFALGLAAVAVIGYAILGERGSGVIVRPAGSPSGGATALLPFGKPGVIDPSAGTPVSPGAASPPVPVGATPTAAPSSPSSSPAPGAAPSVDLSWIFGDGTSALKAGFGNVFKTAQGLAITGPYGALNLKNPDVIHASEGDALKAGAGSFFVKNGAYYVTGPAGAVKVSERFRPEAVGLDLASYGSVQGVIRGWTVVMDRLGNATVMPAHSVQGSSYAGSASGAPPTADEWAALGAKVSLPQKQPA